MVAGRVRLLVVVYTNDSMRICLGILSIGRLRQVVVIYICGHLNRFDYKKLYQSYKIQQLSKIVFFFSNWFHQSLNSSLKNWSLLSSHLHWLNICCILGYSISLIIALNYKGIPTVYLEQKFPQFTSKHCSLYIAFNFTKTVTWGNFLLKL